jgi:hypothetical protein
MTRHHFNPFYSLQPRRVKRRPEAAPLERLDAFRLGGFAAPDLSISDRS